MRDSKPQYVLRLAPYLAEMAFPRGDPSRTHSETNPIAAVC
jgi:hypothetical protein